MKIKKQHSVVRPGPLGHGAWPVAFVALARPRGSPQRGGLAQHNGLARLWSQPSWPSSVAWPGPASARSVGV
jgi:hypothetical protein